ncbi:MerR family transcriptional regulator [Gluconacetobacter azotocaptans]|uniref:MerR family transcriptional regulator n=1 Tax=Gluconacetobacter azotocaptans TaxID=142834 RepID=UPI001C7F7CF5|nr:MerR family transcriptional regulator [Gluconacetobacter azotocaptans]GBQ36489.1 MerR family transcriptional regulator [Gluconacetobacter azotocaptans DSM 13594]
MSGAGEGHDYWQAAGIADPDGGGASVVDDGAAGRLKKAPHAFRTISEVADELHVPQHVLRFWETRFAQVRPLKRGGGRRYYRPDDIELLRRISDLLYVQGYTIKGVQRMLREGTDAGAATETAGDDSANGSDGLFQDAAIAPAACAEIMDVPHDGPHDASEPAFEEPRIETVVQLTPDTPAVPQAVEWPVATPPTEEPVESVETGEIERIRQENVILKDSLRGILIELKALRRLIPV